MARAVSTGRKKDFACFGWRDDEIPDPEAPETFERSKLNWNEVHAGKHAEMLEWTRKLIALRHSSLSLNDGDRGHVVVDFDSKERWLLMVRNRVRVALNLGQETKCFPIPEDARLLMASSPEVTEQDGQVMLPPDTLAIMSSEGMEKL